MIEARMNFEAHDLASRASTIGEFSFADGDLNLGRIFQPSYAMSGGQYVLRPYEGSSTEVCFGRIGVIGCE
jgi:hypothetical protein